jgi:hypothetical protein
MSKNNLQPLRYFECDLQQELNWCAWSWRGMLAVAAITARLQICLAKNIFCITKLRFSRVLLSNMFAVPWF